MLHLPDLFVKEPMSLSPLLLLTEEAVRLTSGMILTDLFPVKRIQPILHLR